MSKRNALIFLIWCNFAVIVLLEVNKRLNDPFNHLKNWGKEDPCMSNWTGILCYDKNDTDGYLHVREL